MSKSKCGLSLRVAGAGVLLACALLGCKKGPSTDEPAGTAAGTSAAGTGTSGGAGQSGAGQGSAGNSGASAGSAGASGGDVGSAGASGGSAGSAGASGGSAGSAGASGADADAGLDEQPGLDASTDGGSDADASEPIDECPDDPDKTAPGVCGCGEPDDDGDDDDVADCMDECPSDPEKTAPGMCGCGEPEDDGDADDTPDCIDECPEDPEKTEPGLCGCDEPEDDGDDDDTPDCVDECDGDPEKTEPGVCGCGVSDEDSDTDEVPDCEDACPLDPGVHEEGTISFTVTLDPGASAYASYFDGMERCLLYAGNRWASHLIVPHDVTIELMVTVASVPTANGGSEDSVFRMTSGLLDVYDQGVAAEIRSGTDPNGSEVDATITWGIVPLTGTGAWFYWFDPDPETRTAAIPGNALDAVSTCMHELGHVLLWNGWRDYVTWDLPSDYLSVYDFLSTDDGENVYFEGELAMEAYEGAVPETYNAPVHIGNLSPRPGMDLDLEVMHGTPSQLQHRYDISPLMLAFLADAGLPVRGTPAAGELCGDSTLLRLQVETEPILGPKPAPVE